ncbi:hypothetical protein E0K89_006170 [Aquicoccus sp. SCR17]|nr:hypothetical protein [Carideicomes alvinocaridis]
MKKVSTIAAATVFALASAAPVLAEQKVDSDPFASTQAAGAGLGVGAGIGIAVGVGVLVAVGASSDT